MINVLITLADRPSIKLTSATPRYEIDELLTALSVNNGVQYRWGNQTETSPLMIYGVTDPAVESFLLDTLGGLDSQVVETATALPVKQELPDPRKVEVIDSKGDGIQSYPILDSNAWVFQALVDRHVIYSLEVDSRHRLLDAVQTLESQIKTLGTLTQFLYSISDEFGPSPESAVETPSPISSIMPEDLQLPSKKSVQAGLEKLLGPMVQQPQDKIPDGTPNSPSGTFLILKQGAQRPLQMVIHGDANRLKDIGYLAQIKSKYSKVISLVNASDDEIRTVVIGNQKASQYMELLRSVLMDCNLLNEYRFETREYLGDSELDPNTIYL